MFGLDDIMKKVDLGDVLSKFNLGDKEKEEVQKQAVDAMAYRAAKEKKRGNEGTMQNLLSSGKNNPEADVMQKKLEGDLAFNLKNKSKMEPGLVDKIKTEIMAKFLGGASGAAKEKGDEDGKGLMSMFSGGDLLKNLGGADMQKKLKGFF
jgi:hypothetical protein